MVRYMQGGRDAASLWPELALLGSFGIGMKSGTWTSAVAKGITFQVMAIFIMPVNLYS